MNCTVLVYLGNIGIRPLEVESTQTTERVVAETARRLSPFDMDAILAKVTIRKSEKREGKDRYLSATDLELMNLCAKEPLILVTDDKKLRARARAAKARAVDLPHWLLSIGQRKLLPKSEVLGLMHRLKKQYNRKSEMDQIIKRMEAESK